MLKSASFSIDQITREIDRFKSELDSEREKLELTTRELRVKTELLNKKNEDLKQFNKSISGRFFDQKNILTALIESSHEGIIIESANGDIKFINDKIIEILGISGMANDFINKNCDEIRNLLKHQFIDPEAFDKSISDRIEALVPYSKERMIMKTGDVLERDFLPIFHEDEHLGNMWKYEDVTAFVVVEDALRASEEKYRGVIEDMAMGFIEVDAHDKIVKVYDSFCKMTGFYPEELIGQNFVEVLIPEDQRDVINDQHRRRADGEASIYEIRMNTKDGQGKWILASGTPIINDRDKVFEGSMGMFFDLTDRKILEDNLRHAQERAEKSSLAEKQFLANMSHEIRNPINSVAGLTSLLADTSLDEEQKEYVDNIKHSAEVLLGIISGILDLSKIESGETQLDEELIYIDDIVNSALRSFQHKIADKPLKINNTNSSDTKIPVIADATVINQILFNLLGNAIKFTEEGEINLSFNVLEEDDSHIEFEFHLSDTGIGMAQNELAVVFEKFKQANKATKLKYGGTGLGLAIVKKLISLYDGVITATSELNKGTTFLFNMRFQKANETALKEESLEFKDIKNLGNASVLIVEDNRINQIYLAGLMKKWNLRYEIANNGQDALQYLKRNTYNIILMDIRMPEMDGYETTKWIREHSKLNKKTPIIALTASALIDERQKALACGMNEHLPKPFSESQLLTVINKLDIATADEQVSSVHFEFSPFIDSTYILSLFHDDLSMIKLIMEIFLDVIESELDTLKSSLENHDFVDFGKGIHKIKPNFLQVGFTEYREILETMQARADAQDGAFLYQLFEEFNNSFLSKLPMLKAEYKRLDSFLDQIDQ